jgi:hypothetical protein
MNNQEDLNGSKLDSSTSTLDPPINHISTPPSSLGLPIQHAHLKEETIETGRSNLNKERGKERGRTRGFRSRGKGRGGGTHTANGLENAFSTYVQTEVKPDADGPRRRGGYPRWRGRGRGRGASESKSQQNRVQTLFEATSNQENSTLSSSRPFTGERPNSKSPTIDHATFGRIDDSDDDIDGTGSGERLSGGRYERGRHFRGMANVRGEGTSRGRGNAPLE